VAAEGEVERLERALMADPGGVSSEETPYQRPLPVPWQLVRSMGEVEFAHPAERAFARILTYYRIRWVYEPTAFTLASTADGRPVQMFTPDFYLPDYRLYIELTTMRQRLVTRKNRKLRRLRELYPNVRVKLLYRRDVHRLVESYATAPRPDECHIGQILFTEEHIRERIEELATDIDSLAADEGPLLALAVNAGATRFSQLVLAALRARGAAVEPDRVRVSRFRMSGRCHVRVSGRPRRPLAGRRVLLLTDMVSTGLSLAYLRSWLLRQGVDEVHICTLLDRRVARLIDVPVWRAGFEAPDDLLIGFGLCLRRQFSDLPFIATIATGGEERGDGC
jgi:hypoxanthine phosphoribosyltransferase